MAEESHTSRHRDGGIRLLKEKLWTPDVVCVVGDRRALNYFDTVISSAVRPWNGAGRGGRLPNSAPKPTCGNGE